MSLHKSEQSSSALYNEVVEVKEGENEGMDLEKVWRNLEKLGIWF